jgi:dTMP kinase
LTPRFLSFEGGEGAGKSTQIKLLAASMAAYGLQVELTREPGGSPGAEIIRKLLVEGEAGRWQPTTEALLFMTARYDHLHGRIKPALAAGAWVLCDRFYDSSYVYQGLGKQVGGEWLNQLYSLLFANFGPDLTLLLDINPQIGLTRAQARSGAENRFENMDLQFHEAVRQGFLARAKAEPARIKISDAAQNIVSLHAEIIAHVNTQFGLNLLPSEAI